MRNSKLLLSWGFSAERGWIYLNRKHQEDFTQKEDLVFIKLNSPEFIIFEETQCHESSYWYEDQIKDLTSEKSLLPADLDQVTCL